MWFVCECISSSICKFCLSMIFTALLQLSFTPIDVARFTFEASCLFCYGIFFQIFFPKFVLFAFINIDTFFWPIKIDHDTFQYIQNKRAACEQERLRLNVALVVVQQSGQDLFVKNRIQTNRDDFMLTRKHSIVWCIVHFIFFKLSKKFEQKIQFYCKKCHFKKIVQFNYESTNGDTLNSDFKKIVYSFMAWYQCHLYLEASHVWFSRCTCFICSASSRKISKDDTVLQYFCSTVQTVICHIIYSGVKCH